MSNKMEYKLSDIATIIDCEHKTAPTVISSEYLSIRTSDISIGKINYDAAYRVSEETYYKWTNRAIPQTNDIILAREAPVGEVGIIRKGFNVCLGQRTVLIKVTSEKVYNLYLLYYLCTPIIKYDLQSRSTGSVVLHLNVKDIRNFNLSFPPLPEQKAIASVLSSLDDKIDLLHRQNKNLEAMAETLFRQWFVEGALENWEEVTLKDFINVKHGYAFKGKSITTETNNQILVTPGNFKIGGGFKFGKMKYFFGSDYSEDYIFSSDDLIVTMTDLSVSGDTLGYPALIPEHNPKEVLYLHNQRVGKVEFKKDISKYFIYYLMKTDVYQWFILSGASGTAIRHTSPTSICSYPFQVPPVERIKEFDTVVSELVSKMHKNQKKIKTLEQLRDTLLPKLMSGEVQVKV